MHNIMTRWGEKIFTLKSSRGDIYLSRVINEVLLSQYIYHDRNALSRSESCIMFAWKNINPVSKSERVSLSTSALDFTEIWRKIFTETIMECQNTGDSELHFYTRAIDYAILHSRHTVCNGMALVSLERRHGDYARVYTLNIPRDVVFGSFMEIS